MRIFACLALWGDGEKAYNAEKAERSHRRRKILGSFLCMCTQEHIYIRVGIILLPWALLLKKCEKCAICSS